MAIRAILFALAALVAAGAAWLLRQRWRLREAIRGAGASLEGSLAEPWLCVLWWDPPLPGAVGEFLRGTVDRMPDGWRARVSVHSRGGLCPWVLVVGDSVGTRRLREIMEDDDYGMGR